MALMMKKDKFTIGPSADIEYELKKTLELQMLYISALFNDSTIDTSEAIHEARRSFKKCRAILRLMRDAMGYASYRRENISLREMQKELTQTRDAYVQFHLLAGFSEDHPELSKKSWFDMLLRHARTNYEMEMDRFLESGKAGEISGYARTKAEEVQNYELTGNGFEIIEGGLSRIYRQGLDMGRIIFSEEADPYEVHAFRKRGKYLQFQLSYLRTIAKPLFNAMSKSLEKLTENLGHYNDLYIATTRIQEYAEQNNPGDRKHLELLLAGLREDMQKLLLNSRKIYEMQYAETPGRFIERIGRYLELQSR